MDSKWPFMLITVALLFALGATISQVEKTVILKNWESRRCELPIMAAGIFFKPDSDTRSAGTFAKENFSFCMKKYVDDFLEIIMKPVNAVFKQQVGLASSGAIMMNTMRKILKTIYDAFLKMFQTFFHKFNSSIFELSRIMQYMKMAAGKLNAVMMSMIYTALTMFRGMINTIKFIFKVVLIICGIMLGIIIILFFILFPFIPLVLTVLGIIIYNYVIVDNLIGETSGGSISEAERYESGFCFSEDTVIQCKTSEQCKTSTGKMSEQCKTSTGKTSETIKVQDIRVGDELLHETVTTVIKMSGKNIPLYNLNGIYVSGSHLVKGNTWHSVSQDPRAIPTNIESDILYCFNTTSHNIPVLGKELTGKELTGKELTGKELTGKELIIFRDWEEIPDEDLKGQYLWNYMILKRLNKSSHYNKWKDSLNTPLKTPLNTPLKTPLKPILLQVKTSSGYIDISKVQIHDKILDRNGEEQVVLGTINGMNTPYEEVDGVWIQTMESGNSLITETGEIIIQNDRIIRDYTEIGYDKIHETYPFVESRLKNVE